ncbi:MAG: hypothetical protein KatS3mg009_0509 [Acidimicrobiia bacterium]|nr:MAG: hypothetical protein KatS3mg009_0509 [Acidimicrobiia bacterium]
MRPRRLLPTAAAAGAVVVNVVDPDSWLAWGSYHAVAAAAVAVVLRAAGRGGRDRRAWQLLGAGLACWYAGDLFWDAYEVLGRARPDVSVADAAYLAGYPLLGAAIGRMVALRAPGQHREGILDGAAFAAAAVVATWHFLVAPSVEGAGLAQALVWGAYPVADLVLLAAAGWLLLSPGRRGAPTLLVSAFLVTTLAADIAYLAIPVHWPDVSLVPLDAAYLASYVALAIAAAHPHADELTATSALRPQRLHPARIVVLGVALVAAPLTAAFTAAGSGTPTRALVASTSVLCAGLVLARFSIAVRQCEAAHELLARRASRDELTGLHNRPSLLEDAAAALENARRGGGPVGVLYVDIDRFKSVNDTWGHEAGDEVLREAARRLREVVRPGDTIARVGGDEFVVVLREVSAPEDVEAVAVRIRNALAKPVTTRDAVVTLSASVGMTMGSGVDDVERLLRDADVAMYRAKQRGRNRVERYEEGLHELLARRAHVEAGLRGALANDELRVYYQPVVDARTGIVRGVEALLRWRVPGEGVVAAGAFMDVAEDTGLIVPMGRRVLEAACRDAAGWDAGSVHPEALWVAVNVSPRQFAAGDFAATVERTLAATGARPEQLVLEITESVLVSDVERTREQLARLVGLGVRVAVDDFGTGYSALAYLRQFPIEIVKLDRQFVREIGVTPERATMAGAVIQLAHTLGHEVVAEGVEERHQVDALVRMGCDYLQGHHYAPALPPEDLRGVVVDAADHPAAGAPCARVSGPGARGRRRGPLPWTGPGT